MNAFYLSPLFRAKTDLLPIPANIDHRYHLIRQKDGAPSLPMKLHLMDNVVVVAEIPGENGCLKKDFPFYQHIVNDRAEDAWPEITEQEFTDALVTYRQYLANSAIQGPGLTCPP